MQNDTESIDFESHIGPWLGKTVKLIDFYLYELLQSYNIDLSKEQLIVLKRLHDKDGMNQNELAFITLRNKSSLTRLLSNMEKKKLIIRKQSAIDKRINHVHLTNYGIETFERIRPILKATISTIEKGISEVEKAQLISLLKKIQLNFDTKNESI